MTKMNLRIRLVIRTKCLTANEVTQAIGLQPSKSWNAGERRPGTVIVESESVWIREHELPPHQKCLEVDECIESLLCLLEDHRVAIVAISEKNDAWISCVIRCESPPGLFFKSGLIERIAALGLGLDFDMYLIQPGA